jgi:hypothetical protein
MRDGMLRRLITTVQGYSSGMILGSSVTSLPLLGVGAMVFVPVMGLTLPLAAYMGRRAFVDDRARRTLARRQELKRLTTRYLDEIGFVVHKDSRDTLRRLQREVRDHYTKRAAELERTFQQALAAAEQARNDGAATAPLQPVDSDAGGAAVVRQIRRAADRLIAVAPIAS